MKIDLAQSFSKYKIYNYALQEVFFIQRADKDELDTAKTELDTANTTISNQSKEIADKEELIAKLQAELKKYQK